MRTTSKILFSAILVIGISSAAFTQEEPKVEVTEQKTICEKCESHLKKISELEKENRKLESEKRKHLDQIGKNQNFFSALVSLMKVYNQ